MRVDKYIRSDYQSCLSSEEPNVDKLSLNGLWGTPAPLFTRGDWPKRLRGLHLLSPAVRNTETAALPKSSDSIILITAAATVASSSRHLPDKHKW
jgi:hypothetical protein